MSAVKDLRIYTLVKEVTKGTSVTPATRRLIGDLEIDPVEEIIQPQPQIGILAENPTTDALSKRHAEARYNSDLTYQELVYFLNMILEGGGSATTPVGTTEKVWTFDPALTADPTLNSFTLRRRLSDGAANFDEAMTYVMGDNLRLSGAIGENAKLAASLWGRPVDRTIALGTPPAIPVVNFVPVSDAKLYINNAGAIGTTQLLGSLIDWELNIRGMAIPGFYQDGRTDKSFSSHKLRRLGWDFRANVEVDATTEAERTAANARTMRHVRLEFTGPIISGSALPYKLTFDMPLRHREGLYDQAGDRDGNDIFPMEFIGAYDSVTPLALKCVNTNDLAAL